MNHTSYFDAAKTKSMDEVLAMYGGVLRDTPAHGGNISCPFHEDRKPSFRIYRATNTFHCFSCKAHGTVVDFVQCKLGLASPLDAAKQICQDFGIPVNADTYVSAKYKDHTAVHKFCMELFQKNNDPGAHRYWEQRGLSTTVQKYGLGWCPKNLKLRDILRRKFPDIHGSTLDAMGLYDQYGDCKFGGRYMFTIFDGSGHPIGFAGRSLTDPAKYINSIETDYFKKGRLLYNWHIAKGYPSVIVVEGYTDCLALVQSGIPYVVATMGSALTKEHLVLLEGKEIVLAFDNDNTGQESMAKIIEQNPAREFYVLQIPDAYKDYGEALAAGENLMRLTNHQHRRHRADWLLGYLSRTIDLSELSGREHLYNRMNALARHVSPVTKDYITIKIQRKLKGERAA